MDDSQGPPPVGLSTLVGDWTSFPAPLAMAPVHHHADPFNANHRPCEVREQAVIAGRDHDQEPETGRWSSARRPQKLRQVSLAEAVRFGGILQRLALSEIRRRPLGPAPRADRSHCGRVAPTAVGYGRSSLSSIITLAPVAVLQPAS